MVKSDLYLGATVNSETIEPRVFDIDLSESDFTHLHNHKDYDSSLRGLDLINIKGEVQDEVLVLMRNLSQNYDTGLEIIAVRLQNVNPPVQVQDAFDDVTRAREERDRIINL